MSGSRTDSRNKRKRGANSAIALELEELQKLGIGRGAIFCECKRVGVESIVHDSGSDKQVSEKRAELRKETTMPLRVLCRKLQDLESSTIREEELEIIQAERDRLRASVSLNAHKVEIGC